MAFTNTWDTTFPPDSQLANQLGQDLRSFRLDVQQRMGAISGLDASKPVFGSDAQPANWNGILFFATDTCKIYQFNNPSWTDVTASILTPAQGVRKLFQTQAITSHTGTTTLDDIYTMALPALIAGNSLRLKFFVVIAAQGNINTLISLYDTAHADVLFSDVLNSSGIASGVLDVEVMFYLGTNVVTTVYHRNGIGSGSGFLAIGQSVLPNPLLSSGNLILAIQNGHTTDHQNLGPALLEFIP